jgi:glutathione peroxidase
MMRTVLGFILLACAAVAVGQTQAAPGADGKAESQKPATTTQPTSLHQFTVKDIDGRSKPLGDYAGKVVLVVNVASKCGFTKQYEGLQALYEKYKDKGLVVLGVPSNDFKQETGSEAEIKAFCSTKYAVTFPMLAKMSVKNGPDQSELYRYLTDKSRNGVLDAQIAWNFNKVLVGKDGKPVRHFASKVKPDDPPLVEAIEEALDGAKTTATAG